MVSRFAIILSSALLLASAAALAQQPADPTPVPTTTTPSSTPTPYPEPDPDIYDPYATEPVLDMDSLRSHVHYPKEAVNGGLEGQVVIRVLIDENGRPAKPFVQQSVHPLLDSAATEAVMATTFEPAMKEGQPVKVWVSVPIRFQLSH